MKRYVLDANAVIEYLGERPAAARVGVLLNEASRTGQQLLISVINWGEVIYRAWADRGETAARDTVIKLSRLPLDIVPALTDDAFEAARLKSVHKLPYADSFAAALTLREKATLVTGDPHFERLGKQLPVLWLH